MHNINAYNLTLFLKKFIIELEIALFSQSTLNLLLY